MSERSVAGVQRSGTSRSGEHPERVFIRWVKFNAVGAVGAVVQLAVLAALMRMTAHYLVATALAIEVTLIHNFAWHLRFTWRERRGETGLVGRLVRFHLSNGLVSMLGNLALMPWLVGVAGMPVVVASGVAIVGCSVVNFYLGDGWVFAGETAFSDQRSAKTG
ncbi:MAG TPA: GtrA family protein [Acidobacteriaceae bacterium]|jgi:putative flippase GtrA|nr:GtrA family protein [Acidobacteriaceae bacterium]